MFSLTLIDLYLKGVIMANIDARLTALEKKEVKTTTVTRFICKGNTPTKEEQAKFDEAGKFGLVIVRTFIST